MRLAAQDHDATASCGSYSFDIDSWICVATHPQCEVLAREHLRRQNFVTYFPRIWMRTGPRAAHFEWCFPRYGFVRLNLARRSWSSINSTLGVAQIIEFGDKMPAIVPNAVIERLRRAKLDRYQVPPAVDLVGKQFEILSGPLERMQAICTWNARDRVKLLVSLLGREITVELTTQDVKLVE